MTTQQANIVLKQQSARRASFVFTDERRGSWSTEHNIARLLPGARISFLLINSESGFRERFERLAVNGGLCLA